MAADLALLNDRVTTFPIHAANYGLEIEAIPAGDTLTATSDNPALVATIGTDGAGNSTLVLTPASGYPVVTGINIKITDSTGLTPFYRVVDLGNDTVPTSLTVDETMPAFSVLTQTPAAPKP